MERDKVNDNFLRFPYRKQTHDDGRVNNGGIDLTIEPDRIDEIQEAQNYPWLKKFLSEVNGPNGLFMTFGCDFGPYENYYAGYFDFSFRPHKRPSSVDALRSLDENFYKWISDLYSDDTSELDPLGFALAMLQWSHSPLEYQGTFDKVGLWYRHQEIGGCEWLVNHVRHFLVEVYPSLPRT